MDRPDLPLAGSRRVIGPEQRRYAPLRTAASVTSSLRSGTVTYTTGTSGISGDSAGATCSGEEQETSHVANHAATAKKEKSFHRHRY